MTTPRPACSINIVMMSVTDGSLYLAFLQVGSPSVKQSHSPVLSLSSHKVSPGVVLQVGKG